MYKVCGVINCNKLTFNRFNPTRPQTPCFFGGSADERFIKASSSTTYKTTPSRPLVNLCPDDTWGWELTDLYVAHREIVTNRAVPNLLNKKEIGNGASCKRLITMLLQNGWCRTSWGRGTEKQISQPRKAGLLCSRGMTRTSIFG